MEESSESKVTSSTRTRPIEDVVRFISTTTQHSWHRRIDDFSWKCLPWSSLGSIESFCLLRLGQARTRRAEKWRPDRKVDLNQQQPPRTLKLGRKKSKLAPYVYENFESPCRIRLLHLLPGLEDEPVAIRLTAHGIEDEVQYEALSYTWGSIRHLEFIECEGKSLSVTPNLLGALKQLRFKERARILWIDALCINQADIPERNSQVLLMSKIYTRADSVIVWLGYGSEDTGRAFELLHKLLDVVKADTNSSFISPEDLLRLGLPNAKDHAWAALDRLLWRDWFFRVWIIQEIALAKSAIVFCGEDSVPWHDLIMIMSYLWLHNVTSSVSLNTQSVLKLARVAETCQRGTITSLHYLLVQSRFSRATNERDHVYALLGLANDQAVNAIRPDYQQETEKILTMVTGEVMKSEQNLDVLSSNPDSFWSTTPGLASWVPDWPKVAQAESILGLGSSMSASGNSLFEAGIGANGGFAPTGYTIDTVRHAGLYWRLMEMTDSAGVWKLSQSVAQHLPTFQNIRLAVLVQYSVRFVEMLVKTYPTGEATIDVYLSTIFAGQDVGESTPLDLYRAFDWHYVCCVVSAKDRKLRDTGVIDIPIGAANGARALIIKACLGRRFCVTDKGYLGLFPASTRSSDVVVLLRGGKTPYVIRKRNKGRWRFIGECYIHGYMKGEAWDEQKEMVTFTIT